MPDNTPWWMDPRRAQQQQMRPLPYAAPQPGQPQPGMRTLPYAAPPPSVDAAPGAAPPRSLLDLLGGGQSGGANPVTPQQSMAMGRAGLNMMRGQMPGQPQQPQQAGQPSQAVNPELAMMGMQRPFWMNNLQQLSGGNPNTSAQLGFPYGLGGQR